MAGFGVRCALARSDERTEVKLRTVKVNRISVMAVMAVRVGRRRMFEMPRENAAPSVLKRLTSALCCPPDCCFSDSSSSLKRRETMAMTTEASVMITKPSRMIHGVSSNWKAGWINRRAT